MEFIAWHFWAALQRWRSQGLPEKSWNCSSNSLLLSLKDLSQVNGLDPDPTTQMLASTSQLPSHWRAGACFECHSASISCSKSPWTCKSCPWIQPPSLLLHCQLSLFNLEAKTSWQCLTSCGSPKHARKPPWNPHHHFPFSALSTPISPCFPVDHDTKRKTSFVLVQVLRNR